MPKGKRSAKEVEVKLTVTIGMTLEYVGGEPEGFGRDFSATIEGVTSEISREFGVSAEELVYEAAKELASGRLRPRRVRA